MNASKEYPVGKPFASRWASAVGVIVVTFAELPRAERQNLAIGTADLTTLADAAAMDFFEASMRTLSAAEADTWASFESSTRL